MIFSNTEFYFSSPDQIDKTNICLTDEEAKHLTVVMRHAIGENVYVTDGNGNIFDAKINLVSKSSVILEILNQHLANEKFPNITIFIPLLKSSDRMETALEKCVELGFTNFAMFSAEKSPKRGIKLNRLDKIALAAMKQSLQANKPKIRIAELKELSHQSNFQNVIFDQLADKCFTELANDYNQETSLNLIFGPEAGLTEKDIKSIMNITKVYLTKERLRAETAVIVAASTLSLLNTKL